jgi:uncharacterized iron-regulated membrane protein
MQTAKKPIQLSAIHRAATLLVVVFTLYLGFTGSLIQLIDLNSIFTNASPFDPNVKAMREAFDGPGDYQVIMPSDYLAPALPAGADLPAMLGKVMTGARASLGDAPLGYVELRMSDGRPAGLVKTPAGRSRFDTATGAAMTAPPPLDRDVDHPASQRNTVKELHRMTTFGDNALWINIGVSIALVVLMITGVWMYGRMLVGRFSLGRKGLFWSAGGWWRSLHRAISVIAATFLSVVALSGAWLAVDSLGHAFYDAAARKLPPAARKHVSTASPVRDGDLGAMLNTTLAAYGRTEPHGGLRVVRLRWYAGMPQGVVVTGEPTARQLVFNAATGRQVSETEPGYPPSTFPFGWQAHQTAKAIHRGSMFGLSGRFMDVLAGLSMVYLSVSGIVMYADLWSRRRKLGRRGLVWN